MSTYKQARTCACGASVSVSTPFGNSEPAAIRNFLEEHRDHGQGRYTVEDIARMRFTVRQIMNWEQTGPRIYNPAAADPAAEEAETQLQTYMQNGTTPSALDAHLTAVRAKAQTARHAHFAAAEAAQEAPSP